MIKSWFYTWDLVTCEGDGEMMRMMMMTIFDNGDDDDDNDDDDVPEELT